MDEDKKEKRLSRLQPNVTKLLDCPVCFERITPPVTVCHNGHAVCNTCRRQLLSCPTCKAGFSANKNTILDQIIEENIYTCKYAEKGCTVEMRLREIVDHEQSQCIYRTIVCTIANARGETCKSEVSLCQYYNHVSMCHKSSVETIDFSIETRRSIDVTVDSHAVRILRDAKMSKIVFEVVKIDRTGGRYYITYVYIGTSDEANKHGYELRIVNPKDKYRELKYKSLCIPLGTTEAGLETSERCLVLSATSLPNFVLTGDQDQQRLLYTVKFEGIAKKWYKKVGRRLTHGLTDDENAGSEEHWWLIWTKCCCCRKTQTEIVEPVQTDEDET